MIAQSVAFNEAALEGRRAFLDLGPVNAKIQVFGNTRPASINDAPGAAPLVEFVLTKPCGSVGGNLLSLTAATAFSLVMNSGTPTWARVINGDDVVAMDADAGTVGSGAEVEISEATLLAGGRVSLIAALFG